MKRLGALAMILAAPAAVAEERRGPENSYFVGTYEFVGRAPGAKGRFYGGWATLRDEGDHLSVARCLGGETEAGRLEYTEFGSDRLIFLKGSLWADHGASCQFANDNENYPRLTCYTWPADDPTIAVPGLETYFPVDWPLPDHAKGCAP